MSKKAFSISLFVAASLVFFGGCNNSKTRTESSQIDSVPVVEEPALTEVTLPIQSFMESSEIIYIIDSEPTILVDSVVKPCTQREFETQSKGLIQLPDPSVIEPGINQTIVCGNKKITVINDPMNTDICRAFQPPTWVETLNSYFIEVSFGEGSLFMILDKPSGKSWVMTGKPMYISGSSYIITYYPLNIYESEKDNQMILIKVEKEGNSINLKKDKLFAANKELLKCFHKDNKIYVSYYINPYNITEGIEYGVIYL